MNISVSIEFAQIKDAVLKCNDDEKLELLHLIRQQEDTQNFLNNSLDSIKINKLSLKDIIAEKKITVLHHSTHNSFYVYDYDYDFIVDPSIDKYVYLWNPITEEKEQFEITDTKRYLVASEQIKETILSHYKTYKNFKKKEEDLEAEIRSKKDMRNLMYTQFYLQLLIEKLTEKESQILNGNYVFSDDELNVIKNKLFEPSIFRKLEEKELLFLLKNCEYYVSNDEFELIKNKFFEPSIFEKITTKELEFLWGSHPPFFSEVELKKIRNRIRELSGINSLSNKKVATCDSCYNLVENCICNKS